MERSGARRPRQRGFAGQRHSDFRGGQRGFGDEDFRGPVRMVKNRFPDLWGVWIVPARLGDDVEARSAWNLKVARWDYDRLSCYAIPESESSGIGDLVVDSAGAAIES